MTASTAEPLLEVTGLGLTFGSLVALDDVSFEVGHGERLGIIGPNGAGKTTILNCLNGVLRPRTGRIRLDGEDLVGSPGHAFVRFGIGRTFQGVSLLPHASVAENVQFGSDYRMRSSIFESALAVGRARREDKNSKARVREILDFLGIADLADVRAGDLPWGRQKVVEIGRAIAAEPKLLLLDEPTSGMSHDEKVQVSLCLARLQRERGLTQILIEHDAGFVSDLCDRVVVLDYGKVIATGTPAVVMADPKVAEAYLGTAPQ